MDKLIKIASASLSRDVPALSSRTTAAAGVHFDGLLKMLTTRNGFYAFEGALHVFPARGSGATFGIEEWNEKRLWKSGYSGAADDGVFFAEDVFGGQFCIKDDGIFVFDPETGQFECFAKDLEEWAGLILSDYEVLTGYPLAREWQLINGPIPEGHRLLPKIPFVMGGDFALENLRLCKVVEGMRFRAEIAAQIRDLPDGTNVSIVVTD